MILLVNPPYSFWSPEKNYLRPFINTLPSQGLLILAAILRQNKYTVKIIESASLDLSFSQTIKNILQEKPRYLGIHCTTASVDNAGKLAKAIKEESPKTLILVGGPHITALPVETFSRYPVFDYGVVGEGEVALLEILEVIENKRELQRVKSAIFRENGEILVNSRGSYLEKLDDLPFPAYDLLPFFPAKYQPPFLNYIHGPSASLSSSRGCPQRCTFCDRSVFGNRYRYFSEDYLIELISYLSKKYKIRHLIFTDDQFAASKNRLVRLCEKMAGENLKIIWNCDARVDSVDPELLKLMKRAGCWMISYGIESGSQEILDGLKKGIRLDQVKQAVHWTKEAGIRTKGLFMTGYPQETEETLRQTLSFILHCPLDEMNLSFLTPYPGTEIYEQARYPAGFSGNWDRMNAMNPTIQPRDLSQEALRKAYSTILRKFYLRPGITFSYLRLLLQSRENCTRLAKGIYAWLRTR